MQARQTLVCIIGLWLYSFSFNTHASRELIESEISQLLQLSLSDLLDVSVTTASKMQESIKDTPVATLVITKQQIYERGYRNLLDVMQDLPGFDVQKYNHQVEYHSIAMHGHVGSHKFLILQDGVRIDSPTGEAIAIAQNFPVSHAKQIEVIYGPAAALYGADAFGGVINIITEPFPEYQSLSLVVGTKDYRQYSFQAGGEITPKLSFNLSGQLHKHDYSDLFNDYPALYQQGDLTTLGSSLYQSADQRTPFYAADESKHLFARLDFDDQLTLGFNHSFLRSPSTTGSKPDASVYGSDEVWDTEINSGFIRFKHSWTDALQTETMLHYADYEIDPISRFKNIYVDYLDSYIYDYGEKYSVEQQLSYQLNEQHQFIAGLSFDRFYSIPKTTDLPQTYNKTKAPTEQDLYHWGTDNSLPIDIYELRYHTMSGYAQWQAAWRDDFSSTIGIRYDRSSRYSSTLNPRLGLVYQPNEQTTLKLFYGEAFRQPSPTDTHEVFGIFSGLQNEQNEYMSFFFHVPNETLEPEKVRSLQFNVLHSMRDNIQLSLNAYYTTIQDRILSIAEPVSTQFIEGGQILSSTRNENFGTAKQYGADVSVLYKTQLGTHWDADVWAHYSYIEGYNQQQGSDDKQPLRLISPHKLKLGATFRYQQRYVITPKLYFIGRMNDGADTTTGGYAIMDLHLGAAVTDDWSASVDIYNLFNRRHYHAGLNTLANLADNVQPLRSVILSLRYQF